MDSYLISDTPYAGQRGWSGSRALLQLQQRVGGRCLVRRGGMGALTTDGGGGVQSLTTISGYTEMTCGVHGRFLLQSLTHYSVTFTNSD